MALALVEVSRARTLTVSETPGNLLVFAALLQGHWQVQMPN